MQAQQSIIFYLNEVSILISPKPVRIIGRRILFFLLLVLYPMHHLFPVNLNLQDRKCLVIGGGRVAERKVRSLLQCGADIWVVSPELTEELEKLAREGNINRISRHYIMEDLDDCFLVISAVDNRDVNSKVAHECFARNIPVNVVDDPARCTFTVPSVLRRGPLCISVSTTGKSPLLARRVREQLEDLFGVEYAEFLELMGEIRSRVLRDVPDGEKRRRIFECLINSDILELIRRKTQDAGRKMQDAGQPDIDKLIEERIAKCTSS